MKNKSLTIKQAISRVAVLTAALIIVAAVSSGGASKATQGGPAQPFVITYTHYKLNGIGPAHVMVTKVASNGKTKTVRYVPQNGVLVEWAPSSETLLALGAERAPIIPATLWTNYGSFDLLRASEGYAGDNKVLDYEVCIIRSESDGEVYEEWYNPRFGPIVLKSIEKTEEGIIITEATSIELREVLLSEVE